MLPPLICNFMEWPILKFKKLNFQYLWTVRYILWPPEIKVDGDISSCEEEDNVEDDAADVTRPDDDADVTTSDQSGKCIHSN